MKDYYLILGLAPDCTTDGIKKAYRQMSLKYHPDKNQSDKYFEERFKDINEAYGILNDTEKRKTYDYQRMFFYKNNSNSGDDLRQKEENLNRREADLNSREHELSKVSPVTTEKEGSSFSAFIFPLLFVLAVLFLISIYRSRTDSSTDDTKERLTNLENDLKGTQSFNQALLNQNDSLKNVIERLRKNQIKPLTAKNVIDTTLKQKRLEKNEVSLPFKVKVRNTKEIQLLNLAWYPPIEYPDPNDEYSIVRLSVYNKTDKWITSVNISYEVTDPNGTPINSGVFTAEIENHSEGPFAIGPNKALKCNLEGKRPEKKPNDFLVMTITDYQVKD
jgi:curved DNA-binding protein CbpA